MYLPFKQLPQKYVLKNLKFLEGLKYVKAIFSRSLSVLRVSAIALSYRYTIQRVPRGVNETRNKEHTLSDLI